MPSVFVFLPAEFSITNCDISELHRQGIMSLKVPPGRDRLNEITEDFLMRPEC